MRACQARHRGPFAAAAQWVARLADAQHGGHIHQELTRLGRLPLIVVDEVGYIPFEPETANLFSNSCRLATNRPASSSARGQVPANAALAGDDNPISSASTRDEPGPAYAPTPWPSANTFTAQTAALPFS